MKAKALWIVLALLLATGSASAQKFSLFRRVAATPGAVAGDTFYTSNADGTISALGIGSNGECLKVTSSLPDWAACVANDSVTYAMLQNISATQRVLGRNTAAAGDTEEVTITQAVDWFGCADGEIVKWAAGVPTCGADATGGGGGSAHVIEEAGVPLTARGSLNFLAGFDLTDDAGGDETEVALDLSEVAGSGDLSWSTNTPTIANDAVTMAKLADLAASRLIGRRSGSAGDPEAVTLGSGLSMSAGGELTSSGGVFSLADVKDSVRAATTVAGTLATSFENGDAIDGVTLATGDRILIKNQATGAENGVYTVAASGAPTRATDFDADAEVTGGAFVFVSEGTTNGNTGWVLTTDDPITVGTTALTFAQFTGGGAALTVEEVDAAPSVASVTKLRFDQADGFSVVDDGGGQATVNFTGGGGMSAQDHIDVAWGKQFFSDASLLPATERIAASLVTVPTEAGVAGAGTFTRDTGHGRLVNGAGGDGLVYWDLGALRTSMLVVIGGATRTTGQVGIFLSSTAPASANPDGYLFTTAASASDIAIYKCVGGGYTALSGAQPANLLAYENNWFGMAFYYDDTTGALKGFLGIGGRWFLVVTATDSTYTTMRYVSFRQMDSNRTARLILPFAAWSE